MQGKTHVAVGVASAMLLMQPKSKEEFIVAAIGGSIGGIMADIDVKVNRDNKFAEKNSMDAVYGRMVAATITIIGLVCNFLKGGSIIANTVNQKYLAVAGLIGFIVLSIIGHKCNHRKMTHSFLYCALFSISVALINIPIGIAFGIGYLSHLLIDIFNKSPEQLFFPKEKGVCLKLCYADKLGNEMFLCGGIAIILFLLLI